MPWFWARQNFRKPEEKVIGFSYAFLGVRLECAQCHKHPFDQWTQDDFNRFGAFFNKVNFGVAPESREAYKKVNDDSGLDKLQGGERNRKLAQMRATGEPTPWHEVFVAKAGGPQGKVANAKKLGPMPAGRVVSAKVLGGDEVSIAGVEDPRAPLMDWLRSKDNPYFARAFVNRVWANYFGAGLVNPTDDMNLANPPSNAPLLRLPGRRLRRPRLRHEVAPPRDHPQRRLPAGLAGQRDQPARRAELQSRAVIRRLPAEVLIDAVAQATAGTKDLAAASTDLADRAIGPKAGQGQGRRGPGNYAAKVFGSSTRETNCDCNRSDEPNLLQAIYLQNDADLDTALEPARRLAGRAGRPQGQRGGSRRARARPRRDAPGRAGAPAQAGEGPGPEGPDRPARRADRLRQRPGRCPRRQGRQAAPR